MKRRLSLGLDLSTQKLSATVVDIDRRENVHEHSLDYARDSRLGDFGIRGRDYIVPPRVDGEADQPPDLYFASLDALFDDLKNAGVSLKEIVVINDSGQQHGHVYLNSDARLLFARLNQKESVQSDIVTLLSGCLAYGLAPIWMTSNTVEQAEFVRAFVGGKGPAIKLSGSDMPLRFTGSVVRRVAQQFPGAYRQTDCIQLISSLIPAILTGNSRVPTDYGNASGTSLMNYSRKQWSGLLVRATSDGLPGGATALRRKLPPIVPPDTIVGTIAAYFAGKYGFDESCRIVAGSGDNPQSKVLVAGDLLSLGTSLVNMVATDGKLLDMNGYANAMYDGVGRPFMFGCRTNGAMVWDQVRAMYGMGKEEYATAEGLLQQVPVGRNLVFWQPRMESFPVSAGFALSRAEGDKPSLGTDYAGVIETALAAVYHHSRGFARETTEPLHVTGGARNSPGIMRRVSAIWRRQVIPVAKGGAALGAAIAGACAFLQSNGEKADPEQLSTVLVQRGQAIQPKSEDVSAIHEAGGFMDRFTDEEAKLIKMHSAIPNRL